MLALVLLAAVTLAPPFGDATATGIDNGDGYLGIKVEVEVDASYSADFVVVHVLNPDGQETFTMGEGPAGTYSGSFTIRPFNRAIVFEAGRAGTSALSSTVSLVDLGVDSDLLQTTFTPPGVSQDENNWGWLALAAAALAGFALLVYFVWPTAKAVPEAKDLVDATGSETVTDQSD